jgi:hypothetical protein
MGLVVRRCENKRAKGPIEPGASQLHHVQNLPSYRRLARPEPRGLPASTCAPSGPVQTPPKAVATTIEHIDTHDSCFAMFPHPDFIRTVERP